MRSGFHCSQHRTIASVVCLGWPVSKTLTSCPARLRTADSMSTPSGGKPMSHGVSPLGLMWSGTSRAKFMSRT